ncbi:class I SAM-dependent methyltransferase [Singulisphaera sp. GP187]|uniref:class I SAM-dependent methyltransferase n=1 Tax=Singulisphaera sp. GP187 TaxID=1882752 RepID=UPI000940B869|nr:methyltransferase domain-containing protein [Singulisphaera sp. GP187]
MTANEFKYVGEELDLFAQATIWKSYVRRQVTPYLGRNVLEVGAGHGGTTRFLIHEQAERWVCLEPDPGLADRLAQSIANGTLPASCAVVVGTLDQIAEDSGFDTLLYMDVLEHIEDDHAEMARAMARLRPGGHVVVLSPAHQWLYTPFDKAIGHFRRYTRRTLRATAPQGLTLVRLAYLDSVGMLASLGNRLVLQSAMPNRRQIAFWDKFAVRLSRVIDPILGFNLGKSVLGIWRKDEKVAHPE